MFARETKDLLKLARRQTIVKKKDNNKVIGLMIITTRFKYMFNVFNVTKDHPKFHSLKS